MNRYRITHQTTYTYSGLVQLGSHALRLRPREGYDLRIESSILTIQPPAFLRWHRDVEGNSVAIADFNALSDQLLVESVLLIEKYDQQPLDFLVEEYAVNYPFAYAPEDCAILHPYRWDGIHPPEPSLVRWLSMVWRRGEPIESYTLLQRMNRAIYSLISYQRREEPGVQTPAQTLIRQSGSCRDSAGWKGFDPTRGDIVGEDYIPVAVGRLPHFVPPISGSFRGNALLQSMTVSVVVERLNS